LRVLQGNLTSRAFSQRRDSASLSERWTLTSKEMWSEQLTSGSRVWKSVTLFSIF